MKIKLVLARIMSDYNLTWTETKTVEVEIPMPKQRESIHYGEWQLIGAEWPEKEKEVKPNA